MKQNKNNHKQILIIFTIILSIILVQMAFAYATPPPIESIICGDSVNGSAEQCDDGNSDNHDGCSNYCTADKMSTDNIFTFTFLKQLIYGTNPFDADNDSDNDGLTDADEVQLGTDPNNPDTDGDGWTDGYEKTNLHNPTNPDENRNGKLDGYE